MLIPMVIALPVEVSRADGLLFASWRISLLLFAAGEGGGLRMFPRAFSMIDG